MQKTILSVAGLSMVSALVGTASAIPMTTFTQTTASAGAITDDSALAGTVTNQMFVQPSDGLDWTNSEMLINLTVGSVYNATNAVAADGNPNPAFFTTMGFRNGAFDTFVTGGGFDPAVVSGASTLLGGPGGAAKFGSDGVDLAWGDLQENDFGNTFVGQFTLSADAVGTYTGVSIQTGAVVESFSGSVVGGVLVVPEPASLGLVGLGGLALLRRRRD